MTRPFLFTSFAGVSLVALVACSSGSSPPDPTSVSENRLVPFQSCSEVTKTIQDSLVDSMKKRIQSSVAAITGDSNYGCSIADTAAAGAPNSQAPGATSVSKTNNQVEGVDEADFVKNDNRYIYVAKGSELKIIEAWPAATAHTISATKVEGTAKKLFIDGDRAIVYSSLAPSNPNQVYYGNQGRECKYGYDCIVAADGTGTKITIFDISNKAAPVKLRELSSAASLVAARKVGSAVHTVFATNEVGVRGVQYEPANIYQYACKGKLTDIEKAEVTKAFADLVVKNEAILRATDFSNSVPSFSDSANVSQGSTCGSIYKPTVVDGSAFTGVVSFDAQANLPIVQQTILGRPGHVYASEKSLYFTSTQFETDSWGWFSSFSGVPEVSTVHKFSIGKDPIKTAYSASGLVKGHILSQFSMDERNDVLRIATSSGRVPSPNVHSTVSALAQSGANLFVTGSVDNIAPKEDIRAVRFDGEKGYLVTFKKTDPLYVVDLKNPQTPKLEGELHIPGFSTYMHMMDSTHLLTIGYDAEDHGDFAYFQGVLVQIFDVSDPKNPTLAHKATIGTRGSSSEALADHLAFNYFSEKNLLALPMTICENSGGGSSYGKMTFSGLMVYDASVSGLALKGKVAHPYSATGGNNACGNWWSNASSEVKRSIFMDDFVYSISESLIKVNNIHSLSTDTATISL